MVCSQLDLQAKVDPVRASAAVSTGDERRRLAPYGSVLVQPIRRPGNSTLLVSPLRWLSVCG